MEYVLEKATRQHTRGHNSRLVLRKIYDAGEISRAALARLTQLTRTTVSEVVAELIDQGLVQEVGQGPVGVGRTPTLLSVVDDARSIVAVDITHREIQGALLNLRGAIRRQARLPLSGQDGHVALELLFPLLDSLIKAA
ncbi:MAG TPA: helix-turn-helix domain-containing protein, partial [Roseiflexaceae bacterium]|nr:helix-turn-helix domain-containing protein [Roseiflexaceae bacterium]